MIRAACLADRTIADDKRRDHTAGAGIGDGSYCGLIMQSAQIAFCYFTGRAPADLRRATRLGLVPGCRRYVEEPPMGLQNRMRCRLRGLRSGAARGKTRAERFCDRRRGRCASDLSGSA